MNSKHSSKRALLIVDMINHFQFKHGEVLLQHSECILTPLLQLKAKAKQYDTPVIYINDHYNLWQADFQKIIKICQNNLNNDFLKAISPENNDYFLIKPKHSAFYGTALHTLLAQLHVTELIITGIAGNICVLFTANDAYMRDYSLICPEDCIASVDQQDNQYALAMMKHVLKANINKSNTIPFD